ncbi:5'/3'-nucleotidase SurE [Isosphaeraceae bacterium EP7]
MFLLTNDDGIDAPGLAALEAAVLGLGPASVVAPASAYSGCGHVVTTHGAIAYEGRGDGRTAVHGTPADCVRLALHGLTRGVTWILSGINSGGNLGADIHHSGTVAAVREGVLHGIPGVAFSHYLVRGRTVDWEQASRWTALVLQTLRSRPPAPGSFWNVNFPHPASLDPEQSIPEIVFCEADPSPLPLDYLIDEGKAFYRGDYHTRQRRPGLDVDVCFGGRIAISNVLALGAGPDTTDRDGARD